MNKTGRKPMRKILAWSCILALLALTSSSRAQDSACLTELVPCLPYIKSQKTPSKSCCDPLRSLIRSDPQCLCSMLGGTPGSKQAGVNTTEAQKLPARCGEKVTASMCSIISKRPKNKGSSSGSGSATPNGLIVCSLILLATWMLRG